MDDNLLNILADLQLNRCKERTLVQWAIEKVSNGDTSNSLILLAGLTKSEVGSARDLFIGALAELSIAVPPTKDLLLHRTRTIAKAIVRGAVSPSDGCSQIREIAITLDYPGELADFVHLEHLKSGHEQFGWNRQTVDPEIMRAARQFLGEPNQ